MSEDTQTEEIQAEEIQTEVAAELPPPAPQKVRSPGVDGFDEEFEADYLVRFVDSKRRNHAFYDFQPCYRYGYELATDRRYADSEWKGLEPQARRFWTCRNSSTSWDEIKEAVQFSYHLVKTATHH